MSSGSDRRLRSQGNPEIGQASNIQRSRTTSVDKNLPQVASLPPKPPAIPTGVGILFNQIPMNQGKPSDAQDTSSQTIVGPSEVPGTMFSNEATGLGTHPPISTASPLAREDNEVQKELITRVAEHAAVAKVSELCPRLLARHINDVEQKCFSSCCSSYRIQVRSLETSSRWRSPKIYERGDSTTFERDFRRSRLTSQLFVASRHAN